MKVFGIIVLLAAASCSQGEHASRAKRGTINDNLASMLESLKETMVTGSDTLGIPVLEPYTLDTYEFSIDNDDATAEGTLTNLEINGLSNYTVETIKFSLIGVKFTFALTWPSITYSTGYSVNGKIIDLVPIYGEGNVQGEITNLAFSGVLGLSATGGHLYVRTFTNAVSVEDLSVDITGLLDNEEFSSLISTVIEDAAQQVLVDYQTTITDMISSEVTTVLDEQLTSMSLSDLLALIS